MLLLKGQWGIRLMIILLGSGVERFAFSYTHTHVRYRLHRVHLFLFFWASKNHWSLGHAGHFLPEEDDKFIERVRAAVEEEERQAKAAAAASAAKDAIATAEESRKASQSHGQPVEDLSSRLEDKESQDQIIKSENANSKATVDTGKPGSEGPGPCRAYDSLANLPLEFYHYYHGSNTDMGTLIEVNLLILCFNTLYHAGYCPCTFRQSIIVTLYLGFVLDCFSI